MVTRALLYKTLLAIGLMGVNSAADADTSVTLHFVGLYDFDWGAIPLGKLALCIDDAHGKYRLRLQVVSAGIVNLFTHHVSETTVTGLHKGGIYHPRVYESHYKTKNKPRHIKLTFNARNAITQETVEPPEDPAERPAVPHKLKDGSYDPLSGMMALRSGLSPIRAFDAKRLYTVKAVAQKKMILRLPMGKLPAQPYLLSRAPLGGLTAKEHLAYNKGEPPLLFYFSDDAKRIPLMVRMPLLLGGVRGILVKECKTWDECALN